MGFEKEFRGVRDEFPEWEYLNRVGVKDMFGNPIDNWTTGLVIDRQNNYYLIPMGHTNPNRDSGYIHYYALCIEDKVLNLEVVRNTKGRASDSTYECEWIIEKINLPDDWTFDFITKDQLKNIITDAFRVETFSKTLNLSNIKSVNVLIATDF